ncbi:hypothetical protein LissoIVSPER_00057 [Lissonota sp. PSUC_FEM 10030012]|nr:hypothetical protein [Lissonota sp. PSUC_FEM 10030012]
MMHLHNEKIPIKLGLENEGPKVYIFMKSLDRTTNIIGDAVLTIHKAIDKEAVSYYRDNVMLHPIRYVQVDIVIKLQCCRVYEVWATEHHQQQLENLGYCEICFELVSHGLRYADQQYEEEDFHVPQLFRGHST